MVRFIVPVILTVLIFNVCSPKPDRKQEVETAARNDLMREAVQEGLAATFYPAYGYRNGTDWLIPIRSLVHDKSESTAKVINILAQGRIKCVGQEQDTLKLRLADFSAKDIHGQQVEIQFDSDPDQEPFLLGESDRNGLIKKELRLSEAKSRRLLDSQRSSKGWLTYHAIKGLTGKGRLRLIEPAGVSVITDIDDTIKVTEVPGEKETLLKNTFCRDFVAAPSMADMYRSFGDIPFHYVSGGPWQLYGPLYDYLISGPGGYPEGAFHLSDFPKNPRSKDTIESLIKLLAGGLKKTYDHKVNEITTLMERFPDRTFILVGDSGEVDPEVYRLIRESKYSKQVKEIWIRDVVNDDEVNHERLNGMKVIKVSPIICATHNHYQKLSQMLKDLHRPSYTENTLPPCSQPVNKISALVRRLRRKK